MADPCQQCQTGTQCRAAAELYQAIFDAAELLSEARRAVAEHVTGQPHGRNTTKEDEA